jgi:hypothetical protein
MDADGATRFADLEALEAEMGRTLVPSEKNGHCFVYTKCMQKRFHVSCVATAALHALCGCGCGSTSVCTAPRPPRDVAAAVSYGLPCAHQGVQPSPARLCR